MKRFFTILATAVVSIASIAQVVPSTDEAETWYFLQSSSTLSYCKGAVVYNTSPKNGRRLRWGDKTADENAMWKFVSAGDDAYYIVNKATRFYMRATSTITGAGEVTGVARQTNATKFLITPQEGAANSYILSSKNGHPIHAQENYGWMVTWNDDTAGSASSWKPVAVSATEQKRAEAHTKADTTQYQLVWSDEFDSGSTPDTRDWAFEKGFVRNQELQWYQQANATIANGLLVLEGRKESVKNPNYEAGSSDWKKNRQYSEYTSASMNTCGKHDFTYGRLEVRAQIPTASGAWPAIWTLGYEWGGDDHWPHSGEVDLLEYYAGATHANFCWGGDGAWTDVWNSRTQPLSYWTSLDGKWQTNFHTWRMDWDSESIKLYIDDELVAINKNQNSYDKYGDTAGRNPFINRSHYILLNLAMGSNAGGVDADQLPFRYLIDYVRVYQKPGQTHSNRGTTETTTGIAEPSEHPRTAVAGLIYDLQGRRLSSPQRGVSIVGGRKVIL